MSRSLIFLLLIMLFQGGCNPEKKNRMNIESLEASGNERYEVGIACMQYIARHGEDLSYSRTLVKKLLDIGFYAEAINAVGLLQQKFPADAELFFLRALGYRNLHQYALALRDLEHALQLQPENKTFVAEHVTTRSLEKQWQKILSLNDSLFAATDSFNILLSRAEKFFELRLYDAVVYDLGSISKMRTPADSAYFTQKVNAMYKDSQGRPVEKLSEMLEYFRNIRE